MSSIQEFAGTDRAAARAGLRDGVRAVLVDTLGLPNGDDIADESSGLFGSLPELDSLAVVELIVALQLAYDIDIDDEDVTTEVFATLGSLVTFVDEKRAEA